MNVEKYELQGYTVELAPDYDLLDPRKEYDNLSVMCCEHGRYSLGDGGKELLLASLREDPHWQLTHWGPSGEINRWSEAVALARKWGYVVLPLYLYDHSGITMSTTAFACPWDSGQVGWAFVSPQVRKREGLTEDQALGLIKAEVEEYDQYLTGDGWGFRILEDGEEVDSCYGIFGEGEAKRLAEEAVDILVKSNPQQLGLPLTEEGA